MGRRVHDSKSSNDQASSPVCKDSMTLSPLSIAPPIQDTPARRQPKGRPSIVMS